MAGTRRASRAKPASGPGIVLREVGAGSGSGWGARLTAALETIIDAERMRRGRRTARGGNVLTVRIEEGRIAGEVHGSQAAPFSCSLRMRLLDPLDVDRLAGRVRREPGMLNTLASGVVPDDLAAVLLPADGSDIDFACDCPDAGSPCKHAAALALVAAQEMDRRPERLLTVRGIDVEGLIDSAAERADGAAGGDGAGVQTCADPFEPVRRLPPVPAPPVDASSAPRILDPAKLRAVFALFDADAAQAERELDDLYALMRARR